MNRPLLFSVLLFAAPAVARAEQLQPPLLGVEARVGGGLAVGGGAGVSVWRAAPIDVSALVDYAIRYDPWVSIYGAAYLEAFNRAGFGLAGGLRLRPFRAGLRLAAGVTGVIAPYTIGGATFGGGYCLGFRRGMRVCGDVEGTVFFMGDDLPDNRVAAQISFILSVGFDAL